MMDHAQEHVHSENPMPSTNKQKASKQYCSPSQLSAARRTGHRAKKRVSKTTQIQNYYIKLSWYEKGLRGHIKRRGKC